MSRTLKSFHRLLPLAAVLLSGCSTVLMSPAGDVARQQGHLIVVSTLLMLLVIVPVIALTLLFAWRYRASNRDAVYTPDWDHSTQLELVIWGAPLLIIIALGLLTWISTHLLDPYRPLMRLDAERRVPVDAKPLVIDVVAMDWKWLFIYPEEGIAVLNDVAAPVDVPIEFHITATSVMNSFFIPSLAGQVYAMPGMQTLMHAVINRPGEYAGMSANYSGAGFSDMHFKFHGVDKEAFAQWVAAARGGGQTLDRRTFLDLDHPTVREPVRRYATVDADLFKAILNRCVDRSRMCMDQMMAIDQRGDTGRGGEAPPGSPADQARAGATRHPPGHPGAMHALMSAQGAAPTSSLPDIQHVRPD